MKMKIDYFDNDIEINTNNINVIEIENKKYFYRFVSDLYLIFEQGFSNNILFVDYDNNELNMNNKIKVFTDFFDLQFDSKKYMNDIAKYINNSMDEDSKNDLLSLYKKIIKAYKKVLNDIEIPLNVEEDINIDNITKSMKVSIDKKSELLDNLLLLIDIEKVLQTGCILFFINLKQYLSKEEIIELYKYSIYNEVQILLVDSQSYGVTVSYEKKNIIDENLDEFVL